MSGRPTNPHSVIGAVILLLTALVVTAILLPALLESLARGDEPAAPPPGLMVPVQILSVTDGDTLTVRMVVDARVRLLDCWAPELRGTTQAEKDKGLASKKHLESIALGKRGGLYVPFDGAKTLGDVWSFDRILGRVWVEGVGDLSSAQVSSGQATRRKVITE